MTIEIDLSAGPEFPQIQGKYPSWAEINLNLGGPDISDFKSIDWDDAVEIGDVYGAGPIKQGTTLGQGKPGTLKIEIYISAAKSFLLNLANQASDGQSATLTQWNAQLQWADDQGAYPGTNFYGCRVQKIGQASKMGTDAEFLPIEVNVTQITQTINGQEFGLLMSAG